MNTGVISTASMADVAVIGGGPVGLMLANLLGRAGRSVILFEAETDMPLRSMAIGITPPSLDMLDRLGLIETFQRHGLFIREAVVHENGAPVGRVDFGEYPDAHRGILSLPQAETVRLLREALRDHPSVRVLSGWRVNGLSQDDREVRVTAVDPAFGVRQLFRVSFAAGCDGARSATAGWLGIRYRRRSYAPRFLMFDAVDHSGLGDAAHLFFGAERPVESFPLPGGRRRWIVRTGWRDREELAEPITDTIHRLTGIRIDPVDILDRSGFQPRRAMAATFARGRVALCGDAAHVMSPIGGQGMNTGFADAVFLARAFTDMLLRDSSVSAWMRAYNRCRRHAFRLAAARSALGMKLGVMRGAIGSRLRGWVVRRLLGTTGRRRHVIRWFTMRSLPHPVQQAEASLAGQLQGGWSG